MPPNNQFQWIMTDWSRRMGAVVASLRVRFESLPSGEDKTACGERAIRNALASMVQDPPPWPLPTISPSAAIDVIRSRIQEIMLSPAFLGSIRPAVPTIPPLIQGVNRKGRIGANQGTERAGKQTIPTRTYQAGGLVGGRSPHAKADNIPAFLTAGEFVQPVRVVRYYGLKVLEALRKMSIPKQVVQQWVQTIPSVAPDAFTQLRGTRASRPALVADRLQNMGDRLYRRHQKLAQGGVVKEIQALPGQPFGEMGPMIDHDEPIREWPFNRQVIPSSNHSSESPRKTAEEKASLAILSDDRFAAQLERILERAGRKRLQ